MRLVLGIFLALSVTHCGVEAGNSGPKKQGSVKIYFAQEALSGNESLSMQLASLDLYTDSETSTASLTPSVESVDLFGLTESSSVVVAESSSIPVGSYQNIAIRLSGEKPIRYRDSSGQEVSVELDDASIQSFYVEQSFEVSENETTSIVLSIDPYKSLSRNSGAPDRFVFKPRGDARPPEGDVPYLGSTTIANASWVCAYAYSVSIPGPISPFPRDGGRLTMAFGPDFGPRVEDRPSFSTKDDLVKDETDSCDNAFTKAPVLDGKYELRHLLPGAYSLRVFTSTGSYVDLDQDIVLDPHKP